MPMADQRRRKIGLEFSPSHSSTPARQQPGNQGERVKADGAIRDPKYSSIDAKLAPPTARQPGDSCSPNPLYPRCTHALSTSNSRSSTACWVVTMVAAAQHRAPHSLELASPPGNRSRRPDQPPPTNCTNTYGGPFRSLVWRENDASEPTNHYEGKYTKHAKSLTSPCFMVSIRPKGQQVTTHSDR